MTDKIMRNLASPKIYCSSVHVRSNDEYTIKNHIHTFRMNQLVSDISISF